MKDRVQRNLSLTEDERNKLKALGRGSTTKGLKQLYELTSKQVLDGVNKNG